MVRASATHPTAQLMEKAQAVKGRSLLADARRRLFRNKAAVASMALLTLIALLAVFAPFTSPYAFTDQDYTTISCAPQWWPGRANIQGVCSPVSGCVRIFCWPL